MYDTNEKVLVFEPAIRWAGNPNITVALKASCLRVTAQVCGPLASLENGKYHLKIIQYSSRLLLKS